MNDFVHFPLAFKNGESTEIPARKAGGGRTEVIIRTRKSIFIQTRKESEEWYKQPGRSEYMGDPLASWIGVPMMIGDKVLGVVATYHPKKDYVYTKDDLEILQAMANIAAIALENASIYSQLQEKTYMLEAASRQIADREAVLTRSMIASDLVHRLNNLTGTIPIWVNMLREMVREKTVEVQKDVSHLFLKLDEQINHLAEKQIKDNFNSLKTQVAGTIPIWIESLKGDLERITGEIDNDVRKLTQEVEKLRYPLQKTETDISVVLRAMLGQIRIQYREQIQNGQIQINEEIYPDLCKVSAIPSILANAIHNVISNGVEAILEISGTLTVKANNDSNGVKIEIKDTGKGISDENKEKIFTLFFSTKGTGRGYGLWRAKNAIEAIGGKVSFDSVSGKGTTFTILLPKISEEV